MLVQKRKNAEHSERLTMSSVNAPDESFKTDKKPVRKNVDVEVLQKPDKNVLRAR